MKKWREVKKLKTAPLFHFLSLAYLSELTPPVLYYANNEDSCIAVETLALLNQFLASEFESVLVIYIHNDCVAECFFGQGLHIYLVLYRSSWTPGPAVITF